MEIGVVGKPNVGKSTFFSAATLAKAEIASYPFTTIEANRGIAYVRARCPHIDFNLQCDPRNAKCVKGIRYIPVELIDVAGLVPKAHEGRGLGNRFLDDLRQADVLLQIVDASGSTDMEGNPGEKGEYDPAEEVSFLSDEIAHWICGLIMRDWHRISRHIELEGLRLERTIAERLSGLKITEHDVNKAISSLDIGVNPSKWTEEDLLELARAIRKISKPILVVANKIDIAPKGAVESLSKLGLPVVPTSSEFELALRRAAKAGLVEYHPGDSDFKILRPDALNEMQSKALERIRSFLKEWKTTGVQDAIEHAVFRFLRRIVIYPVEDEHKLTDKDGNVLPDAFLMPEGSSARDLAYRVHTELGEGFIRAINARTGRVIGADYRLRDGDVIKIVAR